MSILKTLTEGVVLRDLAKEAAGFRAKWERTGLLEGLKNDHQKNTMAVLLQNESKMLLKEASTMVSGDVEGFAAVAFPLVRRVFGGLLANELVSVQSMSLPSGLIFFLDFTHTHSRFGYTANESIYGGGVVAGQLTGGVNLAGANAEKSFYALNNGYSHPTGSAAIGFSLLASGVVGSGLYDDVEEAVTYVGYRNSTATHLSDLVQYDPDLTGKTVLVFMSSGNANLAQLDTDNYIGLTIPTAAGTGFNQSGLGTTRYRQVRRLTRVVSSGSATANPASLNPTASTTHYLTVVEVLDGTSATDATIGPVGDDTATSFITGSTVRPFRRGGAGQATLNVTFPINDKFLAGTGLGSVKGSDFWGMEGASHVAGNGSNNSGGVNSTSDLIPEIDIKVDSVAVTAMTKKLKAKWTPELGQDLNAYHNLDAEVELTSILSEQIALEIDREILVDLIQDAAAAKLHWSRRPGWFLNRETGVATHSLTAPPDFTGNVSEWYETLIETINDVSAQIHRKTLRGGANFLVVGPEVANILEFTAGFRASVTHDDDKGVAGAVKAGSISKKWDVYVDPYFPRQIILVGRKGSSFLESGYVYAPYVPLQITPTIFGVEDFVPRKGCMVRYAKKMVRPDMYGLVLVHHLLG